MSTPPSPTTYNVLFVCTGNSCRSQMAEALLRHLGGSRFNAQSAGTNPAGYIHPLAIEAMRRLGVPMKDQHSKSWNDFSWQAHNIIITVCDNAACAAPPQTVGQPARAHWSLPDPSFVPGNDDQRIGAALAVARKLQEWLNELIKLPLDTLTPRQLESELQRIGQI